MDPDPEQDHDSEEVVEIIEIDDTEPLSDEDEVVGDDGKIIWKFSVWSLYEQQAQQSVSQFQ